MNKIGLLLSGLLALTGINLIVFSVLAQFLYPKIGFLIFESKTVGSYDPNDYLMDISNPCQLGFACAAVGLFLSVLCFRRERTPKATDHAAAPPRAEN